jgi:histone-lysine N-methyltransferase SETMAR
MCKLSEAYGDAAPSMPFVIKWGKRFRDGRESHRDDPRAGRPRKTGGLATAIADLLEEHPFESTRSLADALGFSRETIRLALHDELGLRRFVLRWVPHALNPAQKQQRVADARKLLEHLESPGGCVITEDESWVYHEYAHDSMWAVSAVDAGTRVAQTIASKKSMISVFWSIRGVILVEILPVGDRFNSSYATRLLHRLDETVRKSRPATGLNGFFLHWDNARPHKSALTMDTATSLKLQQLPHPPYSPDLAPSDFFGALKQRLKGKAHLGAQELLAAVTAELTQITGDVLFSVFEEWKARLHAVIENGGEYIIK